VQRVAAGAVEGAVAHALRRLRRALRDGDGRRGRASVRVVELQRALRRRVCVRGQRRVAVPVRVLRLRLRLRQLFGDAAGRRGRRRRRLGSGRRGELDVRRTAARIRLRRVEGARQPGGRAALALGGQRLRVLQAEEAVQRRRDRLDGQRRRRAANG